MTGVQTQTALHTLPPHSSPPARTFNDPTGFVPPHLIQPAPQSTPSTKRVSPAQSTLSASYTHGSPYTTPALLSTPSQTHLFGSPSTHSLAPLLHNTLFQSTSTPWTYTARDTTQLSSLAAALDDPSTVGSAVTMPHKVAAVSLCDALSPEARACGAINTVHFRRGPDGRRVKIGANTDVVGIREALLRAGAAPLSSTQGETRRPRTGLVVGGGGAARTAVYALWRWLGCGVVYIACREKSEVDALTTWFGEAATAAAAQNKLAGDGDEPFSAQIVHIASVEQARLWDTPDLVVGTVPDFEPSSDGEILAREIVVDFLTRGESREDFEGEGDGETKGLVLEMCYHPRVETGFYRLCKGADWKVVPGTEAMVWQGVEQQVLWREQEVGREDVERARDVVLKEVDRRSREH